MQLAEDAIVDIFLSERRAPDVAREHNTSIRVVLAVWAGQFDITRCMPAPRRPVHHARSLGKLRPEQVAEIRQSRYDRAVIARRYRITRALVDYLRGDLRGDGVRDG